VGLLDFLKNTTDTDLIPEQAIKRQVDYMPDYYKTDIHFKKTIDFLEQHEWELALDTLIELASVSGHYFAEDFWLSLANSADKMSMPERAEFCRKQIDRNLKDLKSKTPFGWTTVKFDNTHFQHHISEKLREEWAFKRRTEDKVLELINQDGIHLKSHGRSGFIYYVDKSRIAEIEFEIGIKGLITYFDSVEHWVLPSRMTMTKGEKGKLKRQLNYWSDKTKNLLDFN
jgi:hypothetical protein